MQTLSETKLSLYEHLDLMDLAESEGDSLELAVREQIATAAAEKVENIHRFLVSLSMMDGAIDAEIDRLREKKQANDRIRERVKSSVQYAMESHGIKKITGKTVTLSLRSKPASVVVNDENAVPAAYKSITMKIPLTVWERVFNQVRDDSETVNQLFECIDTSKVEVSKSAVKKAIDSGEEVPGADLSFGGQSLVVK